MKTVIIGVVVSDEMAENIRNAKHSLILDFSGENKQVGVDNTSVGQLKTNPHIEVIGGLVGMLSALMDRKGEGVYE